MFVLLCLGSSYWFLLQAITLEVNMAVIFFSIATCAMLRCRFHYLKVGRHNLHPRIWLIIRTVSRLQFNSPPYIWELDKAWSAGKRKIIVKISKQVTTGAVDDAFKREHVIMVLIYLLMMRICCRYNLSEIGPNTFFRGINNAYTCYLTSH